MNFDFKFKNNYKMEDLLEIMKILRGKDGCPWDAEQTHKSIAKNFIEETYEVIEAINKDDKELLKEELGDVLLQVVFHAQIENETGIFNFNDVCDEICKKLIVRHPHVFGQTQVSGSAQVLENWDTIKRATKKRETTSEVFKAVPRELPALMRSEKIAKAAAKAGFDFENINQAIEKIYEELDELNAAIKNKNSANIFEELGDAIFTLSNIARLLSVDGESALTNATDKFALRFEKVEAFAKQNNLDLKTATSKQADELWKKAKRISAASLPSNNP